MNEIQKTYNKQMTQAGELYPPTIAAILEELDSGKTVAVAVNNGFKASVYESQLSEITVGNTINVSGLGLGEQLTLNLNLAPDYFLFTHFANGINLSDTMHSGEAQHAVKVVLNDYFKFKGNVQELSKKLTNINRFPKTDIPKSLSELVRLRRKYGDAVDSKQYKQAVNKAYATIRQLNKRKVTQTTALQKAYEKLIVAVDGGKTTAIDKALDYAFNQKVNYINSNIARTEFKRAYDMSVNRQIEEDPLATGKIWTLSSAHPRADFCDVLAGADSFGGGAGWVPQGYDADSHNGCLCNWIITYEEHFNPRYSKERVNDFLSTMSERDRRATVGAKDSESKSNWSKGLEKKGFTVRKARLISKTILNEAV